MCDKYKYSIYVDILTEKGANGKWKQWHTNDRCYQIDEPIWQEWSHAQKENVAQQFVLVMADLYGPLCRTIWTIMFDQATTNQMRQQIAQCRTNS